MRRGSRNSMINSLKSKYRFDLNSGHYTTILNEAEEDDVSKDTKAGSETQDSSKSFSIGYKPVDSDPTVLDITKKIQDSDRRYYEQVKTLKDQILQAKNNLSNQYRNGQLSRTSTYDPIETNDNVLNLENRILDLENTHYREISNLKSQLIQRKKQLASLAEGGYFIQNPRQYAINESTLEKTKIYIPSDYIQLDKPFSNGHEVRKAFNGKPLVFGKDKFGYYVCCLDQNDIDVLYDIIVSAGYEPSEVAKWLISVLGEQRGRLI